MRVEFRGEAGARLVGESHGDTADPPVLLLHGGGQTRHAWGDTARELGLAGFRGVFADYNRAFITSLHNQVEEVEGVPVFRACNAGDARVPNVAGGALPGLRWLGIEPTPLEAVAPGYLGRQGGCARLDALRARRP